MNVQFYGYADDIAKLRELELNKIKENLKQYLEPYKNGQTNLA